MNKNLFSIIFLTLCITALAGCFQSVVYSEKYEGIPIYPNTELVSSTEYRDYYKIPEFKGEFEKVKKFYMDNINQEIWSIEENPLQWSGENSVVGRQGYILKDGEREVSLIIQRSKISDGGNGDLFIVINGSPFKEGKFKVEGESDNWKVSLEYIVTKERMKIDGDAKYIGNNPPKKAECTFVYYHMIANPIPKENGQSLETSYRSESTETLVDSKFDISGWGDREYELEIEKEAINKAYIEIKWEEQGENKIEKIDLNIIE
nr:hypothetical protein [Sedimentibacter sp.]